jgi:hypothetical protein
MCCRTSSSGSLILSEAISAVVDRNAKSPTIGREFKNARRPSVGFPFVVSLSEWLLFFGLTTLHCELLEALCSDQR